MNTAGVAAVLAFTCALGAGPAPAMSLQAGQEADGAEARRVLERLGGYLAGLDAFEFDFSTISRTTADGLRVEYESRYSAAVRRPGSVALRLEGGMSAPTFISDGATLHAYLPFVNKYVSGPAPALPEDVVSAESDPYSLFEHVTQTPGLRTLLSADPVSVLGALADDARSIGVEEIDGVRAHHIRVDRAGRAAHLWIAEGEAPRLVRAEMESPDEGWGAGGLWNDVRSVRIFIVSNWRTPEAIGDDRFVFAPPEGAEEVDDLAAAMMEGFGMGGEEPDANALLGGPAPDFEIFTLDGRAGSLAELSAQGKVVVLDFWATWCPPCREGLPIIAEVMKQYPQEQAVFYAVNVQEDEQTIRAFLDAEGLDIRVALDPEGAISEQYAVSGIPQTVIIGKDGTVQAVHVGLSPNLGDELKREIDAVLAGEKLAAAAQAQRIEAELPDAENLEQRWALDGRWGAVAVDQNASRISALDAAGARLIVADAGGEVEREAQLAGQGDALRLARLRPDKPAEAIVFRTWGPSVEAIGADGERLWSYTHGQGVDDVCTADLTGDGLDEIIIGYNGATGLHVLSPQGELLWKDTSIGNVWHVAAADITGDDRPEVITTSATGQVHLFDAQGSNLRNLRAPGGLYGWMVRAAPATGDSPGAIFVGGTISSQNATVGAMDAEGASRWLIDLPGRAQLATMAVAPSGRWLAVGCDGGELFVLDAADGAIAGHSSGLGSPPQIAWLGEGDSESLLVATGRSLVALRVGADR